MNHDKLVRSTINKYGDFPNVQADMRKIVKYISSWHRMNLDPIINNDPPKAENPALTDLRAATAEFEATAAYTNEVKADVLAVAKAVVGQVLLYQKDAYTILKEQVEKKYADQPGVTGYLRDVAKIVLAEIEAVPPADLLELRRG